LLHHDIILGRDLVEDLYAHDIEEMTFYERLGIGKYTNIATPEIIKKACLRKFSSCHFPPLFVTSVKHLDVL